MPGDLWKCSATEAQAGYRAGAFKPSDVLADILARLNDINPKINVFAFIDEHGAREAAAASDARWAATKPLGAVDGCIVTIKDNINVRGMPCAWGSELFRNYVPDSDETPVQRLRDSGCIILGKTTVSEFTVAQTNVSTRAFGTTRNPWDLQLTTGASSGGACGATAAGIGHFALGTDGGGSIRRPASHCGLVGLKPSTGRVARRDGLPIILDDCEVIGPIARTVPDITLAFDAIARPDPADRNSLGFCDTNRPLRKVWYTPAFEGHSVDADIAQSCDQAAERLAAMGFEIERGPNPFDMAQYDKCWAVIRDVGLAWLVRERPWRGLTSDLHARLIENGQTLAGADYVEALSGFREIQAAFGDFFRNHDLFMTPTAGTLPWAADGEGPARSRVFTGIINAAGYPGISIPCEPSQSGLPIGFQLVGPFGTDRALIEIAAKFEECHPWAHRRPPI
jgi:aspartyl-tRNA(Asn)/glutamyl-tRNA(Gln) amidotransferase subunit A